ncbi:MAG TPA: NfeD family protein [Planctomycetota bacterium]|nr:NfeD family protein [Planctomycetota bacterium]
MLRAALAVISVLMLALTSAPGADPIAAPTVEASPVEASPAETPAIVAYTHIDGEIDDNQARFLRRVLADAKADGARRMVVHITSDGGELGAAGDMLTAALAEKAETLELIAFVDDRAISAAALLAYGHHRIYLTPQSGIGDIGVIFINQAEGKIEYAPEKIETVVRGKLRLASENRGWNAAKLMKMTARNQELYRFDLPEGQVFVLEHDLPTWLADHPTVDADSKIVVKPKDSLLYYTAREAVDERMATALVADLDEVYGLLGVERAAVRPYAPTATERLGWLLAGWAPILFALGALCIFIEFKAPGVGLWATLGAGFFGLFFICQYFQDLAGNLEIVLIVLGVLAVALEFSFLPTGGILALLGMAAALSGALLAFMPDDLQFQPGVEGWGDAALAALVDASLALIAVTAGVVALIWTLPRSPAMATIAANAEIATTSAGALEKRAATVVGRRAVARTDLRPSGFVTLDDADVSAVSEHGEHLLAGSAVEIVGMRYGEAIVRPAGGAS